MTCLQPGLAPGLRGRYAAEPEEVTRGVGNRAHDCAFGWWAARACRGIPLGLERRTAAAGRCHVGVRELEARTVRALDVVDLRLVQVLEAQGVDVEGDAV